MCMIPIIIWLSHFILRNASTIIGCECCEIFSSSRFTTSSPIYPAAHDVSDVVETLLMRIGVRLYFAAVVINDS